MAYIASSAKKRTQQKTARTKTIDLLKKIQKPSTVTAMPRTESTTGGEVGAKRQTSSEVRAKRETRSEVGAKRQTSTQQAVKHDQHKPDYSLLTSAMLEPMTRALMYGEGKYSRGNFKAGFENIRLTSAALRHIFAYLDREEQDPESGISHLGHAMAALAMLLDNIAEGVSSDVRYQKK